MDFNNSSSDEAKINKWKNILASVNVLWFRKNRRGLVCQILLCDMVYNFSCCDCQGKLKYGKIGEWRFDKRSYDSTWPPRNLPLPPPGVPESVVCFTHFLSRNNKLKRKYRGKKSRIYVLNYFLNIT